MISDELPTITAEQLRAARGWLGWSQQQLAEAAKVNRKTLVDFETGSSVPHPRTLRDIRSALEKRVIELLFDGQRATGISQTRNI
jgi:DNA-binding XRE family transcriptional regulator